MFPKLLLLPIFLFVGTILLKAQPNFRPGYIVKTSGDTLAGLLDYQGTSTLSQKCSFKANKDAEVTIYQPEDLKAYQFDNGKTLLSKRIDSTQYFLEHLFNGCVQIYLLKTNFNDDRYFVSKENATLIELTYTEEKIIRNDQMYLKQSKDHIITLKNLMNDQPDLYPRIEQMDRPEALNLVLLAKAYQKRACKQQKIKTSGGLTFALEGSLGLVNYEKSEFFVDQNYFQTGLLLHLGTVRNAGKFSLRSGLLFSNLQTTRVNRGALKIPIQVEYLYPDKTFSLRLAFGVSLFKPFYQSVALTAGFNVKLKQSSYISFNYDLDFIPHTAFILLPTNKVLSNAFMIGFYQKFGTSH